MNTSSDMSLLAWTPVPPDWRLGVKYHPLFFDIVGDVTSIQRLLQTRGKSFDEPLSRNLLASSPSQFQGTRNVVSIGGARQGQNNWLKVGVFQLKPMLCCDPNVAYMTAWCYDSVTRGDSLRDPCTPSLRGRRRGDRFGPCRYILPQHPPGRARG